MSLGMSGDGARYDNWSDDESRSDDSPVDPSDVFVEEIQKDPEVCNNCFRKNYDVILPWSWKRTVRKGLVRYYIPANSTTESAPHAGETCRNPPRACLCGRIGGYTDRPLQKWRAVDFAWNLGETVTRKGYTVDSLLLASVVLFRKQVPRFGSRDDENFAVALTRSLATTSYSWDDLLRDGVRDDVLNARIDDPDDPASWGDFRRLRSGNVPALPPGTGDRRVRRRPFVAGTPPAEENSKIDDETG